MTDTRGAGEQAKLRMIDAAADLFHKQGMGKTGPREVIDASGASKSQYYQYFKNKAGLVHAVLAVHLERITTGSARLDYNVRSWAELEQWFSAQIENQKSFKMRRGCPFGSVGNELTENDEDIRGDLGLIFDEMANRLISFFESEKAAGRLVEDAPIEQMADFCIATMQGAMLLGKIRRDSHPVETTVQEALRHLRRYIVKS